MTNQYIIDYYFLRLDATVSLSPNGELLICPEKPLTLTCEVSGHLPSPRIEWMVSFEGSLSESGVFQTYVPLDPVGEVQTDHRNGFTFTFNFTSNSSLTSSLVSTLTVTVDTNSSTMIHTPTVNCGQIPSDRAVLHVAKGIL